MGFLEALEKPGSTRTGWAQIVLNLRTGEFFPAEPVGFWTPGSF